MKKSSLNIGIEIFFENKKKVNVAVKRGSNLLRYQRNDSSCVQSAPFRKDESGDLVYMENNGLYGKQKRNVSWVKVDYNSLFKKNRKGAEVRLERDFLEEDQRKDYAQIVSTLFKKNKNGDLVLEGSSRFFREQKEKYAVYESPFRQLYVDQVAKMLEDKPESIRSLFIRE